MNQNLLPISTIIRLAAQQGVSLGSGKPENRIAYFVKTGLLPHAVRRKNPSTDKIEAHFPISILEKIREINHLKKNGASVLNLANGSSFLGQNLSKTNNHGLKTDVKFLIGTLVILIFFLSFAALYLTWNYSPFPQTLSERMASIEAGLRDKASGLLVNLVEEGIKDKVSVGEQVLLHEIPQDLSINSLSLSSDLRVGGDGSIGGTLTVSSESNLYSLTVGNNLNVEGDSLFAGSLNVGGTINGSTLSSTSLTFTGTSASIYPSSSDTSLSLNGGTTGTVNIGNSSTGDVHIAGGTSSSGCTITNNNGSLNCSSDITTGGNLRVNGGTLSTTQTTLNIDVANTGTINFRDSSNTLVSITDEGTSGNINVTGIYKIGGTTGKTIATCGSSQYLGGLAITGGIVTTLGSCSDVSSTTGTDLTLSGDLAVNGGDITSTSSTFNLLNQPTTLNVGSTNVTRTVNIGTGTSADTINIGTGTGTADTINIGGISGTTVNITGGTVNITGNLVSTGSVQGTQLISTVSTGTAPLTVSSTTVVPNLNASLLEGNSASTVMSQPQPNLVLNSDFSRRNKWMTFMPEVFTDTSGWTSASSLTAGSNVLTILTADKWAKGAMGAFVWRDARWSAQFVMDGGTNFAWRLAKWIDANDALNAGNAVFLEYSNGNINLYKIIAGTLTLVAQTAQAGTLNNRYWLELEAQGTTYIGKFYGCTVAATACAKANATLLKTLTGTIADAGVAAGGIALSSNKANAMWGELSTGDGGVYVEGWGPEGWKVDYHGTKGGQSIGWNEATDSGPIGKQWTFRAYIPAATRGIDLYRGQGTDMPIEPSTTYMLSGYIKTTGLGGTGPILNYYTSGLNGTGGFNSNLTLRFSDAGEIAWTRKTASFTTGASDKHLQHDIGINQTFTAAGGDGGRGSATGTIEFTLLQLERGGVATPWRNAPADDGPIVWEMNSGIGAAPAGDAYATTTSTSYVEISARFWPSANLFLPWDASLVAQTNVIFHHDTIDARTYLDVTVDGTRMTSKSGIYDATGGNAAIAAQWMNVINQPMALSGSGRTTATSGKRRVAAVAKTSVGTASFGTAAGTLIITATRGKFDLAEEYTVFDQSIEGGDVVRLSGIGGTTVEKTVGGYQQDILGIISTAPGITLSSTVELNSYQEKPNLRPVALQGRVPVKVTSENGPIKRGDILTSSEKFPGFAMKATRAGRSIGISMENLTCSSDVQYTSILYNEENKGACTGKVMTFVNLSFYDPQVYLTSTGELSIIQNSKVKTQNEPVVLEGTGEDVQIAQENPTYSIQDRVTKEIIERIGAFNNLFVANLKVGSIDVDNIKSKELDEFRVQSLQFTVDIASLSGRLEFLEQTATQSSTFDSLSAGVLGESIGTGSASFNDLTIFNKLITTNLGVTGTIQSGLLSIEGINSLGNSAINTLNGDLYLQNNLLGGVNILSGKVTIDKEGNVRVEKNIIVGKLNISKSDSSSSALGRGVIPIGITSVDILTSAISSESAVFVTPTTETGGQSLIVKSKTVETGFKVLIEKPQSWDITFDWFIVN